MDSSTHGHTVAADMFVGWNGEISQHYLTLPKNALIALQQHFLYPRKLYPTKNKLLVISDYMRIIHVDTSLIWVSCMLTSVSDYYIDDFSLDQLYFKIGHATV